jgi:hypothetical protein
MAKVRFVTGPKDGPFVEVTNPNMIQVRYVAGTLGGAFKSDEYQVDAYSETESACFFQVYLYIRMEPDCPYVCLQESGFATSSI